MLTRFTQCLMALLMAVPMCWCCLAQAMPVTEVECLSCHKFLLPEDHPKHDSAPDSDCSCCQGTLERNLSPDTAATPRLVLVDLQTWVWLPVAETLPQPIWQLQAWHTATADHGPPRAAAPLYHLHCALLI